MALGLAKIDSKSTISLGTHDRNLYSRAYSAMILFKTVGNIFNDNKWVISRNINEGKKKKEDTNSQKKMTENKLQLTIGQENLISKWEKSYAEAKKRCKLMKLCMNVASSLNYLNCLAGPEHKRNKWWVEQDIANLGLLFEHSIHQQQPLQKMTENVCLALKN